MSAIPNTESVIVAEIAAALEIWRHHRATNLPENLKRFKEVYREIQKVVESPEKAG